MWRHCLDLIKNNESKAWLKAAVLAGAGACCWRTGLNGSLCAISPGSHLQRCCRLWRGGKEHILFTIIFHQMTLLVITLVPRIIYFPPNSRLFSPLLYLSNKILYQIKGFKESYAQAVASHTIFVSLPLQTLVALHLFLLPSPLLLFCYVLFFFFPISKTKSWKPMEGPLDWRGICPYPLRNGHSISEVAASRKKIKAHDLVTCSSESSCKGVFLAHYFYINGHS